MQMVRLLIHQILNSYGNVIACGYWGASRVRRDLARALRRSRERTRSGLFRTLP